MSNPYRILEVDASATPEDIPRASRKLHFRYHPDKNRNNPAKAHVAMVEVNTAYEQLTKQFPASSASASTPPAKPPAQRPCSKPKLEKLEKDLADVLPTLLTLEERI